MYQRTPYPTSRDVFLFLLNSPAVGTPFPTRRGLLLALRTHGPTRSLARLFYCIPRRRALGPSCLASLPALPRSLSAAPGAPLLMRADAYSPGPAMPGSGRSPRPSFLLRSSPARSRPFLSCFPPCFAPIALRGSRAPLLLGADTYTPVSLCRKKCCGAHPRFLSATSRLYTWSWNGSAFGHKKCPIDVA